MRQRCNKKKFTKLRGLHIVSILIAAIMILGSCGKNSYNSRQQSGKMVVLTEIDAGDTANIPIGSTSPAGSGNAIHFQKLNSVLANISGTDGSMQTLTLNSSADFSDNPMAIYSGFIRFNVNTVYTLSATDPGIGSISAKTRMPADFHVQNTASEPDDLNGRSVLRFGISIDDAGDEKNYYIFEALKQMVSISRFFYWQGQRYNFNTQAGFDLFQQVKNSPGVGLLIDTLMTHQYIRMNVYTKDNQTANTSIGSLDSPYNRIFMTDSLFNGRAYETEIIVFPGPCSCGQSTGIGNRSGPGKICEQGTL